MTTFKQFLVEDKNIKVGDKYEFQGTEVIITDIIKNHIKYKKKNDKIISTIMLNNFLKNAEKKN